MASKTITVIAIVAVVAVAGVAAIFLLGGMGGGSSERVDTALPVYGNANNDTSIDSKDVDLITEMLQENSTKKLKDYPFADTNADGELTEADLNMVKAIIDKTATKVNIECLNAAGSPVAVEVSYPMKNMVVIGTNMVPVAINSGAVSSKAVVAWYEGSTSYTNVETPMKDVTSLGKSGRSAISDALWKNFTDLDAKLKTETGIGIQGFFVDHSLGKAISDKIREDLKTAGIPEIRLSVADPYIDISVTMMIGFLAGGETEKTAKNYAEKSFDVLTSIKSKLSKLADADKKTYIGVTMSNYICQNESTFATIGSYVSGIPYYTVNKDFADLYEGTSSSVMNSFEALSNFAIKSKLGDQRGIEVIFSNRSTDFIVEDRDALVISEWEKVVTGGAKGSTMNYFKDLDCYDQLWYINNLLPGACKLAYAASCLYPSLYSAADADNVAKEFAKFCPTMNGATPENSGFCYGYEQYQAAKAKA